MGLALNLLIVIEISKGICNKIRKRNANEIQNIALDKSCDLGIYLTINYLRIFLFR